MPDLEGTFYTLKAYSKAMKRTIRFVWYTPKKLEKTCSLLLFQRSDNP